MRPTAADILLLNIAALAEEAAADKVVGRPVTQQIKDGARENWQGGSEG